jgi:hypothetical protein
LPAIFGSARRVEDVSVCANQPRSTGDAKCGLNRATGGSLYSPAVDSTRRGRQPFLIFT